MIGKTAKTIATAGAVGAVLAIAAVSSASAKSAPGIRVAGTCSGPTTSVLKIKHDDGRIEVEFEADQNRNGVRWNVELRKDGRLVFQGARRTLAPSGSFSLERRIAGGTAPVTVRARATRSGETCTATARIGASSLAAATTSAAVAVSDGGRHSGEVEDHHTGGNDDVGGDNHRGGNDD